MNNDVMTNDVRELTDAELDTVEGGDGSNPMECIKGWWSYICYEVSAPTAHYPGGSTPSTNVAKGSV